MLDKIYSLLQAPKDVLIDPDYKPEQAIASSDLLNPNGRKLVVIFPHWGARGMLFEKLKKRYAKQGWAVLAYRFSDRLLEAQDGTVVESFLHIQKTIANDLEKLCSKHNYEEVRFVAISIGSVAMNMVADKFDRFTTATIVVGGDDLANDMWHSFRALNLRQAFQRQHIGIKTLDKHWYKIAPKNHVGSFSGKEVNFLLSLSDMIILTKYQYALVDAIREAGGNVNLKSTRFGHIFTIARFCYFGSPVK